MITIGKTHSLAIVKKVDFGLYVDGQNLGEILLPTRYVKPSMQVGDFIDVFIYLDGEERIIATTEKPYAEVGEFALLKVKSVENIGAFLEWGIMKDILVPFSEQKIKMEVNKKYVVYLYIDPITERITGSMKLEKFLQKDISPLHEKDEVDIMIWTQTDFGHKAIINQKYLGVLYKNETFKRIALGQKMKAYIKKIRPDQKIDLSLEKLGIEKISSHAEKIMHLLETSGGFLPYNDKTDPEVIYSIFGISKKVFKQTIGNLFKDRKIQLSDKGIQANK